MLNVRLLWVDDWRVQMQKVMGNPKGSNCLPQYEQYQGIQGSFPLPGGMFAPSEPSAPC